MIHTVPKTRLAHALDTHLRKFGGRLRELHLPLDIYRELIHTPGTLQIGRVHKALIAKTVVKSGECVLLVNKER